MEGSYVEMGKTEHLFAAGGNQQTTTATTPPSSTLLFDALLPTRGFWRQFRAFRHMALPYFRHQWMPRVMFGVMVLLTFLNSAVRVVFSYLARDFWTALSDGEQDEFYRVMRHFLIALVILAPINVFYRYQRQQLAIHWRGWMTERVLQLYATNSSVYYGLERSSATSYTTADASAPANCTVDNPDQRITEDVRSFTEFSLTLFLTILMATVDLLCFSIILFTILPKLFLSICAFAFVGTVVTVLIGRVLVQLNFEKLQKEADLRFALVRFRENAEQIAFLRGHKVEQHQILYRLEHVLDNMRAINVAVRNLDFFTTYYAYLTWVLPILVIAPAFFAGEVELGVVQQAAASFSHVLDDLSILITQWESLSEFSAGIDRLYTFLRAMQALDPGRGNQDHLNHHHHDDGDSPAVSNIMDLPEGSSSSANGKHAMPDAESDYVEPPLHDNPPVRTMIRLEQIPQPQQQHTTDNYNSNAPALAIHNLTLTTPTHEPRILLHNLNITVSWGEHLLIVGASGVGKSSLLRAMAGLWTTGSGTIQRPSNDGEVYFLPQKPYCCVGSLRDQLLYPRISGDDTQQEEELDDYTLLDILRAVDLGDLPQRVLASNKSKFAAESGGNPRSSTLGLDVILDWSNILSLGEQQRLAFGRLLVNRPRFVILDESTSALDVASETRMYQLLQEGNSTNNSWNKSTVGGASGCVTYVSVGHRPTLLAHHSTKLILNRDGSCVIEPIVDEPVVAANNDV